MPGSDGLTFGKGLSPFAIICPGHDGIAAVPQRIQQAQLVEAGSSVTLSDASALIADDVRFPAAPFVAVEKLHSWSVVVDMFLGVGHTVSINLRNAVLLVGPLLQRLASQMGDNTGAGMELICRVMFDMQQDFFMYISKTSAGILCAAPVFMRVVSLVSTYRADSLSALPAPWYSMLSCPRHASAPINAAPANAPPEIRSTGGGTGTVVNAKADQRLLKRYKDSEHPSIHCHDWRSPVGVPQARRQACVHVLGLEGFMLCQLQACFSACALCPGHGACSALVHGRVRSRQLPTVSQLR